MHPRTQISISKFYGRYLDSILYFTTRSPFSIRYPKEVARYTVSRDGVFHETATEPPHGVEHHDQEYERLRSFFTYGGYSHIYKFHDSAQARKLERRFRRLVKVDISRCFESIYTHSISWVTNGIEDSKIRTPATLESFGGYFDKLMQSANDLETNGILIGPEVSRIFAEIILQEVDVRVERRLREYGTKLVHLRDYEIRRFVDDFFIYCSSEEDAERIISVLSDELKSFRLFFNDAKTVTELTPLSSKRSVAKYQIKRLFERLIRVEGLEGDGFPKLWASVEELLLEFKGILLSLDVQHSELANYGLVRIEFEFERALLKWRQTLTKLGRDQVTEADWGGLVHFIASIMDTAATLFAGSMSASHSVKLARIGHTSLRFMDIVRMPEILRANLEAKIASEIVAFVRRPKSLDSPPVHALVLLDALSSMNERGNVSSAQLLELLNLGSDTQVPACNTIAMLTALRYCQRRKELEVARREIEKRAFHKAKTALTSKDSLDTEATILALSLLDSPYQSKAFKRKLALELKLPANHHPGGRAPWPSIFDWRVPDYYEALQRKRGGEVY
nr:antiviral reverse transcriptase Drt3b [Neomicrococcus lactis]